MRFDIKFWTRAAKVNMEAEDFEHAVLKARARFPHDSIRSVTEVTTGITKIPLQTNALMELETA